MTLCKVICDITVKGSITQPEVFSSWYLNSLKYNRIPKSTYSIVARVPNEKLVRSRLKV